MTIGVVMCLVGIAVFSLTIAACTVLYATDAERRKDTDNWLFSNWQEKLYDCLFSGKPVESIATKVGLNAARYLHDCRLCNRANDIKKIIIDRICGILLMFAFFIIGLVTLQPIIMVAGIILAVPLILLLPKQAERAAKNKKFIIANDLPRFLDLLHTALIIEMPIEQAIEVTATKLKGTVLADELLNTIAETKLSGRNWQHALSNLAAEYEVDALSDFVLDITNAYNTGASITGSVERKSRDIKQTNLLMMKERAGKLTNTILFPVLIFKILPVIALLCIPIIQQLNAYGFGL